MLFLSFSLFGREAISCHIQSILQRSAVIIQPHYSDGKEGLISRIIVTHWKSSCFCQETPPFPDKLPPCAKSSPNRPASKNKKVYRTDRGFLLLVMGPGVGVGGRKPSSLSENSEPDNDRNTPLKPQKRTSVAFNGEWILLTW
ncbi:Hypothetical predicted protein [Podarcis lilfordi]|uniref:Uncharacterized protein n=1 Tax=Podarcis lilfordi TaxID=74358 RepID=A0AA35KZC0_9SAUR|nr:Hypothetical predicted protein [Podarcis lilfordi]